MDESTTLSVREPAAAGSSAAAARLIAVLGADRPFAPGACLSLRETDVVVLGRGDDGAERRNAGDERRLIVRIADRRMSTRHARLVKVVDRWIVEDCESKNGVLVNGTRRERTQLIDGDLIELGHTFLIYRAAGAAPGPIGAQPEEPLPGGPATLVPELAASLRALRQVAETAVSVVLS